ncbi:hypothetical protein F3087_25255 [Nocardia colli]|uniref:Uncharacterized protein n=1 Tax=Nocardia colli TaxID=2545717 RepID=A0A5N0EBQ6_9NOCA|nr:hypothetical protein [Nocardia colli]KAA8885939.1 hypothetical protein F3087_25255 [Nocardia colli]
MFDIPEMPPVVVAFIASERLPLPLAERFDLALTHSNAPKWGDVALMVDLYLDNPDLDPDLRGPLALLGAYAYLQTCEYMLDQLVRRAQIVLRLVDVARRHGVADADSEEVSDAAWRIYELGVEFDDQRAAADPGATEDPAPPAPQRLAPLRDNIDLG